jgi:hypothetical protein
MKDLYKAIYNHFLSAYLFNVEISALNFLLKLVIVNINMLKIYMKLRILSYQ